MVYWFIPCRKFTLFEIFFFSIISKFSTLLLFSSKSAHTWILWYHLFDPHCILLNKVHLFWSVTMLPTNFLQISIFTKKILIYFYCTIMVYKKYLYKIVLYNKYCVHNINPAKIFRIHFVTFFEHQSKLRLIQLTIRPTNWRNYAK